MSNHPRFRFHVQGDDIDWITEIAKVRGPDGYMYEPCWIHPSDAAPRGIVDGDVIMVHNERGAVLCGAVVTERIIPGALSIDHGAKIDLVTLKNKLIDRGGCINLIAPVADGKIRRREGDQDPGNERQRISGAGGENRCRRNRGERGYRPWIGAAGLIGKG